MAERLVQTRTHVPFVDLTAVHEELTPRLLEDIAALIASGQFINGPAVADFERAFAAYCDMPLCVGTASGLDAVRLSLLAGGLARRRRQVRPVEPALAVHLRRDRRLAHQRPRRAGGDREIGAANVVEHADRVRGRLLERLVAAHRGHAEQLDLGACQREQHRDRVVVTGVAVEHDRGRAHAASTPSTSAAVGSDG